MVSAVRPAGKDFKPCVWNREGSLKTWMPHGQCVNWDMRLLTVQIVSDMAIAISYFGIAIAIVVIARRYPNFKAGPVLHMFAAFIAGCGGTHVMKVLIVWQPHYWLDAIATAMTATASVLTFAVIWFRFPFLVELLPGEKKNHNHRDR